MKILVKTTAALLVIGAGAFPKCLASRLKRERSVTVPVD